MALLSANFLFFGKDFRQISAYVSPLAGLKIIIRFTQGFATLTLGFYVAGPLGRQHDAHHISRRPQRPPSPPRPQQPQSGKSPEGDT